ncbi:MAG: hypothetical protein ACREA4_03570 [Nitrososphaera sp.]
MATGKTRGKGSSDSQEAHDRILYKVEEAADAVRDLIRSISMEIEDKIAIDDKVTNISKEAESMLGRIDTITKINQAKLLRAYKKFLERNLEAVNQRIKELG